MKMYTPALQPIQRAPHRQKDALLKLKDFPTYLPSVRKGSLGEPQLFFLGLKSAIYMYGKWAWLCLKLLRTRYFEKIPENEYFHQNTFNFQSMIMSIGFDHFEMFGAISVSLPLVAEITISYAAVNVNSVPPLVRHSTPIWHLGKK
jgi:hypothetical protein